MFGNNRSFLAKNRIFSPLSKAPAGTKTRRNARRRRLGSIEQLENRELMAADFGEPGFTSLAAPAFEQVATASPDGASNAAFASTIVPGSDNSMNTARNAGRVQGVREFTGWVGSSDLTDFYRFKLDDRNEVAFRLDQLSADIDLYVYSSDGQFIAYSNLGGSSEENIASIFEAGTYYVEVLRYSSAESNYRLTLDVDVANESMATANDLGTVNGRSAYTDWVGASDGNDYFRFSVYEEADVALRLDSLTADIDLYVYDSDGQAIAGSLLGGRADEQIHLALGSGTYYVQVTPYESAQSNYRLSFAVTGNENTTPTPTLPDVPNFGGANDWNLNAINAPEAWAQGYTGSGVIVAVVDTGVDYTHSELVSNMWVNSSEIAGNGLDDDGNGFIDDYNGWDFANNDNNPLDQNGHGTHVAGTIAAANNGVGATGVAYGALIMPVQVLDAGGSGGWDGVAAGIRYAVDNGANIINLSLGGGYSSVIASALTYASQMGVFVAAASGNDSATIPGYPARHSAELSNVISVGAHTSTNARSSFSNRVGASGAVQIDAPGSSIYSTLPGNQYGSLNGTSMATPHVAGVAALVLSANRNLSASQLRQVLVSGSNRTIYGSDSRGGINAALAVPVGLNFTSGALASAGSIAPTIMPAPTSLLSLTNLSSELLDATFDRPMLGSSSTSVRARLDVASPASPQISAARLAVIESWKADSPAEDFAEDVSSQLEEAAFESAWDELASVLV